MCKLTVEEVREWLGDELCDKWLSFGGCLTCAAARWRDNGETVESLSQTDWAKAPYKSYAERCREWYPEDYKEDL